MCKNPHLDDISVNNFQQYLSRVQLKDMETNRVISDKLKFIFVSLPEFCRAEAELQTPLDYWLYMLKSSQPKYGINENVLKIFTKLDEWIFAKKH